ncbi:MAG: hypothetical protein Kow0088_12330 [Anaerolineales bacterium]
MMTNEAVSTSALLLSVFWKLGLVLLLIYSGAIYLRRRQNGNHVLHRKQIQVLETTHLSPHRALHLVKIGNHTYLIGATDHNIQLLSNVEDPEDAESHLPVKAEELSFSTSSISEFAAFLMRSLNKIKARP